MDERGHVPIERMECLERFIRVADWAWKAVEQWPPYARDTRGKQLVRASDSVGANLVEGDCRYTDADALHFFIIARASAREARYWLTRAAGRGLIQQETVQQKIEEITSATRLLNILITYRRRSTSASRVREPYANYAADAGTFPEPGPCVEPDPAPLTP